MCWSHEEDAALNGTSRAVSSAAPAVTKCFAVGDRPLATFLRVGRCKIFHVVCTLHTVVPHGAGRGVQAREMLADVDAGQWGTVVEVDSDGDIKAPLLAEACSRPVTCDAGIDYRTEILSQVLFDGQDEAARCLHVSLVL